MCPHGALPLTGAGERRATDHRDSFDYFKQLVARFGVAEQEARAEAAAISRPFFEALQRCLAGMGIGTGLE